MLTDVDLLAQREPIQHAPRANPPRNNSSTAAIPQG
jgi:hypothetical protein